MVVKYLVMTFKNEAEKNVSLSVKGIKDVLTSAEIGTAMDTIISKASLGSSFPQATKLLLHITPKINSKPKYLSILIKTYTSSVVTV